jgi:wyosine [tRNA(Phe)-imidazoG37] synthetase (radical SAM superfamily)
MKKDHDMNAEFLIAAPPAVPLIPAVDQTAVKPISVFARPRDFRQNQFVYFTISPRARGLSIGVNFNPDRQCNFDCVYCEVDRSGPPKNLELNTELATAELRSALELIHSGELRRIPPYTRLPADLLNLRHVALSGDGEPTICPKFREAVEAIVHVRALGHYPFFKIVLITNGSGLDRAEVQEGLTLFTNRDEIWAKLDAGTQRYADFINHSTVPLEKILQNILATAQKRPVIIQSLFCEVAGVTPPLQEVQEFANRLRELKEAGAQIALVQVYSATRPMNHARVRHLPLRSLSEIAALVTQVTGLKAETF